LEAARGFRNDGRSRKMKAFISQYFDANVQLAQLRWKARGFPAHHRWNTPMSISSRGAVLLNLQPSAAQFLADVLAGLSATPKELPCKYFYDERGSQLFDEICALAEYYPTRTENVIIRRHVHEMADQIGPGVMLVEYGSGSSTKTHALLDRLEEPVAYVPVDISREHLRRTANELSRLYPHIEMLPVCADFTKPFALPLSHRTPTHSAVFFPGSTIGNFKPAEARQMLVQLAAMCGTGGGLLIGIDLQKDVRTIEAAYNDARGVTAEFNLNVLRRINQELDGDFNLEQFRNCAVYQRRFGRVELSLVSQCDQWVSIGDHDFHFAAGERIITEYSHKYTIPGFARMAADAGLTLRKAWTDPRQYFAVLHFALLK
jgi:dimethylhistidine N-methyltransferase